MEHSTKRGAKENLKFTNINLNKSKKGLGLMDKSM